MVTGGLAFGLRRRVFAWFNRPETDASLGEGGAGANGRRYESGSVLGHIRFNSVGCLTG